MGYILAGGNYIPGEKKNHVRQTTDRGLFEEATKQQVMPI